VSFTLDDVISRSNCESEDRIVKKNLPFGLDVSMFSVKLIKKNKKEYIIKKMSQYKNKQLKLLLNSN
jgi:hypothetical protein